MTAWSCLAPAKVNACLFVGPPRGDGLHPVVSVMLTLSLGDDVTLRDAPAGASADRVVCPGVDGPNLAGDALAAFRAAMGWDAPPQELVIDKRVPVAAGMGGGSADAAAALRLAGAKAGLAPDDGAVAALAPALGSDVSAALVARPCLVRGVGEQVQPLAASEPFGLLVLPSRERLSTPAVYAEFDRLGAGRSPQALDAISDTIAAAVSGGATLPRELMVNDLEPAARSLCPAIGGALADARAAGADHAMVSGSAPRWSAGSWGRTLSRGPGRPPGN